MCVMEGKGLIWFMLFGFGKGLLRWFLARFDTRQIRPRLPAPAGAPRFPDGCLLHHSPCPTAFGLLHNSPKNAVPQHFQIGPKKEELGWMNPTRINR